MSQAFRAAIEGERERERPPPLLAGMGGGSSSGERRRVLLSGPPPTHSPPMGRGGRWGENQHPTGTCYFRGDRWLGDHRQTHRPADRPPNLQTSPPCPSPARAPHRSTWRKFDPLKSQWVLRKTPGLLETGRVPILLPEKKSGAGDRETRIWGFTRAPEFSRESPKPETRSDFLPQKV